MSISHSLARVLLVILLVYVEFTYTKVHYITPLPDGPCPQKSACITLSQFAANSNHNETDISLLFLPGNHTLDGELFLSQVNHLSMTKDGLDNETVFVECSSYSGRFHISETTSFSIMDLNFIGCGCNNVSHVKRLTITRSTFQGVQEENTVLMLNDVSVATIVETAFLSNSLYYPIITGFIKLTKILDYVYFQRSTPIGALYVAFSNVSIISSRFIQNRADIGGALVIHNSSLQLTRNIFNNNAANFGGVMVTYESTIHMDNNAFINNAAQQIGGVMVTYNNILSTIRSTTFTNNSADSQGGVLATFDDSSFYISNSTFTYNSVWYNYGGVMTTLNSSFNVDNCTFMYNRADSYGAVISTTGDSFNVSRSTFASNIARYGGVIDSLNNSTFDINSCTFINNSVYTSGGVIYTYYGNSFFNIENSTFSKNNAPLGGVMRMFYTSFFYISHSIFTENIAITGGVIYTSQTSSIDIINCAFSNNNSSHGGVMVVYDESSVNIIQSTFSNNHADQNGGVIDIETSYDSSLYIINSFFSNNTASYDGGVIFTLSASSFNVSSSTFTENNASRGGVMFSIADASFDINNSIFTNNAVDVLGGVVFASHHTSFNIRNSTFTNNTAEVAGGVMFAFDTSLFNIRNSTFTNNRAAKVGGEFGGIIFASGNASFDIDNSTFTKIRVDDFGGIIFAIGNASFDIDNSTFTENRAAKVGSVMFAMDDSLFNIKNSNFTNNRVDDFGGVIVAIGNASFDIDNSTFTNNRAAIVGSVMIATDDSSFNIKNSTFTNNRADDIGGVIFAYGNASFDIDNSTFTDNRAETWGGVMTAANNSSFNVSKSTFSNNSAGQGGVMATTDDSLFDISKCIFFNNSAILAGVVFLRGGHPSFNVINSMFFNNNAQRGAAIYCSKGKLNLDNSKFSLNAVFNQGEGLIFISKCSTHINNGTFYQNRGSLYTLISNLTFGGDITFINFTQPVILRNGNMDQEGGAITSFQSTVIFSRESTVHFSNNQASHGGAILASESTITIYGETTIANNMANSNGGGISLKQSHFEIRGKCQIVNNKAVEGGGIHASSSSIAVYLSGTLKLISNSAKLGGGMYLKLSPKVYILKITDILYNIKYVLNFTGNYANYGGAVYVADDTISGACSSDNECFFQTLALYHVVTNSSLKLNTVNILFSENTATEQGSNLFGGLLDRCIPSQFAEVYKNPIIHYSGATYLGNVSNIEFESVSSQPVSICFCDSDDKPDCGYQLPTIQVEKGKPFNVSLVAVDQVNHTVDANITVSLSSSDGGLGEGQQTQNVERICTNLTFNVFSPHNFETLNLYPDGPCGNSRLSTNDVSIRFIACTCPIGFRQLSNSQSSTKCECVCDSALSPYITECNIKTSSVLRKGTNSWITYINDTNPCEYVIYPYCPFDYCLPQTENVNINFNLPKGADSQCAYNRRGILCGACKEDLSLSLASSHCLPCHTHWPVVFVVILLAASVAGILLVIALLALNMTVSVGLINSFIFYANIVSAGSAIFFPSSEPSFPSVFVAWFNLDIGIDVCFIDGLDAYAKTWLQLAFPVYIISIVAMVIVTSEYSSRFAGLIGKRDPVSTLATLILLSYAKLLSITITALSSAVLDYPNGHQETVWLPDGNVLYLHGKHIPLVLVAVMIIIIGLPYTILLFLWQLIVRTPRWKIFKWTRNTKLNAFIASHHVPHNSKYRFWTGLLLLVRVVLYITASVTVSANPQTFPLLTIFLVGSLLVLKSVFDIRVYKNSFTDVVDTALYFNLVALSAFSLYDFKANITKQRAVAYTSTIVTIILFIGAILYHVILLVKKEKPPEDLNEYPLAPVQPANPGVTHSVVEPPKRDDQDPPPVVRKDSDEQEITEDRQIVTPPYN